MTVIQWGMRRAIVPFMIAAILAGSAVILYRTRTDSASQHIADPTVTPTASSLPTPTPTLTQPVAFIIPGGSHVYQTFNNCGPAALSMALSYYNFTVSQQEFGAALRPYQNQQGDNDDKSVTLEELGAQARTYGLIPYHRPGGSREILISLVAQGLPVIARTRLTPGEDIGHYRVVKGYDKSAGTIVQDDSLQGKDLTYSFDEFDALWRTFNYEYLVLAPGDNDEIVRSILGEDADVAVAWERAARSARAALTTDPDDVYARFNLSVALYHTGDYEESVREYEAVQHRLPFRTLWYQIEPIEAYYRLGNYDRVFEISDSILNNANRAYSELYILRGSAYENQGNTNAARLEYEQAVRYNSQSIAARNALAALN